MKSTSICIVGFLFCLCIFPGHSSATNIDVTFETTASINGGAFATNANSGGVSPDTILYFQGGIYSATLLDPTFSIDQAFGKLWVTKEGSGAIGFDKDIPFELKISQTIPTPSDGSSLTLTASFIGLVHGPNDVTLTFSDFSGAIDYAGGSILYSLLPASYTINFSNTGNSDKNYQNIQGHLSDPAPPAVPEPTTLVLLGTGIFGIGIAAWRRRDQKS